MFTQPETRYARNGTIHLAYQVLGEGPVNLVGVASGPGSHVDFMWMEPLAARWLRRLASFSRLVMYDNRGAGMSDPVPGDAAPTMDEQVDDLRVILVSRTVRDLVAGAPVRLESRGVHDLKGVPGSWELFGVSR